MKNIILESFEEVFTLESFLLQVNLKLETKYEESFKNVLKNLSTIIIAFDFEFTGKFRSYIDTRYTYEQLLYDCFLKINNSNLPSDSNHMFKINDFAKKNLDVNATQSEIESKLKSIGNLAVLYFMDKTGDGEQWRKLHSLIGRSIMKYIFLYAFTFRRLETSPNCYVQICGTRFNFAYKGLIARKLLNDEKAIMKKTLAKREKGHVKNGLQPLPILASEKENAKQETTTKTNLCTFFKSVDQQLMNNFAKEKTVEFQLDKFGHKILNKRKILYCKSLSSKTPTKLIYCSTLLPDRKTARRIIEEAIINNIDFTLYPKMNKIEEMKVEFESILVKFLNLHRSCPFQVFLDCYCTNIKANRIYKKVSFYYIVLKSLLVVLFK